MIIVGSLGLSEGTAGAKNLVVPWINDPATPALISSLLPKPLPTPAPKTDAPPCTSSNLVLQPVTGLQWSQNSGVVIRLRHKGSSACLLRGTPDVVASAPGHPNVVATPLGLAATQGEVANTPPGGLVSVDVSVPVACASNPGGADQGLPAYGRLIITLPGGGARTVSGFNLTFPCGMAVTPFFMPTPAPRYPPYWIKHLEPHVSLPTSVKAGGILAYEVTLTNPLDRTVALSPCPAYIEHSSTGIKLEFRLNCTLVHAVPAHGSSIYQIKMAIPAAAPTGPMTVYWGLIGPDTISSHATIDVH
jgi:hypothetical protein